MLMMYVRPISELTYKGWLEYIISNIKQSTLLKVKGYKLKISFKKF